MSLAVLARKTKATAPRFRRDKCFVLNMTGRGQVIGQSAKSHNSKCKTKSGCKDGHVSRCCGAANSLDLSGCKSDCWRGKGSRPAPQLSYSNYLNRRSLGSYRPGGRVCCDTSENQKNNKITWKQGPSISASEMIQQRKDRLIACWRETNNNSSLTGKCKESGCGHGMTKFTQLYKYEMKVGRNGGKYGFDAAGTLPADRFGELCPNKQVLGYTIKTLRYKTGATSPPFKFAIDTTNKENPKRCDIKNIYLVDKDSQRYSKKYSIKNSDKFQDTGNVVKWYWNDDINYWKQREGKCLDVIIEVEKTSEKTKPCAVKKISSGNNISGRNATDLVSYTRINHVSCGTTKTLPYSSSGDQIAFRRTTQSCPKIGLASFKRPMKKN